MNLEERSLPRVVRWSRSGCSYEVYYGCCRMRLTTNYSMADPMLLRCPKCGHRYSHLTGSVMKGKTS